MLFEFAFAVVLTEALTELAVKSEILRPFRKYVYERKDNGKFIAWFNDLVECGYCTSVWIGWAVAILLLNDLGLVGRWVDWVFIGLVVHRCANMLHHVIDRLWKR